MTEPDFEAAKLRVYEEFGIWKPGEKCRLNWMECPHQAAYGDQTSVAGRMFIVEHDIPPPELTDAVAWQVLVEARHRIDCMVPLQKWLFTSDGTPGALILTLAGAGQGAHEA